MTDQQLSKRERQHILVSRLDDFPCSPCFHCQYTTHVGLLDWTGWTCHAYPDGIPGDIASGKVKHDTVRPGQQGDIVYRSKVYRDPLGTYVLDLNGCDVPIGESDA